MAEEVRFELTELLHSAVFKTQLSHKKHVISVGWNYIWLFFSTIISYTSVNYVAAYYMATTYNSSIFTA
jgi:hypothetical protein